MTKTTYRSCLAIVGCALLVAGCATTTTTVIEKDQKLVTAGIDTQDFAQKAEQMVASMLDSGVLDKAPRRPAVIAIGRFVNNTGLRLDMDLLVKKIRVALNKGNKAITDTTGGVLNATDFTLSGKVIDTYATANKKSQHTYTFQLSLTDNQGLAVWEEDMEVSKLTK